MQTISRLYADAESARKALEHLKRRNYESVYLFTAPAVGEDGSPAVDVDGIVQDMMKAYIVREHAVIFADRVSKGASLVTVHAPFTAGLVAITTLESYGPIDSGVEDSSSSSELWDGEHPLSSALRLPLLSRTERPFETVSGIPSLTKSQYIFGSPQLKDDPAPFSSLLGLRLLSDNPTPLSSLLGLPVLIKSGPLLYR